MKVLDIYELKNWGLEVVIEVPKNNSCRSALVVADKDDKKAKPLEIPIEKIDDINSFEKLAVFYEHKIKIFPALVSYAVIVPRAMALGHLL